MEQSERSILEIATERSVMTRALRIAIIVGVVLAIINHGDRLMMATWDGQTLFKIALTFLVPYAVSTYSSVSAVRDNMQKLELPE